MSEEKSSGQLDRWKSAAFDIVDGSALGVFRILWGLIMVLEARWLWNHLEDFHSDRYFHYSYPGFSWIRHFPQQWMTELEIAAMLVAAILMAVGLAFRPAAIIFFLGYAHLFFSEAAAFNNHFYLIILITGILLFTKADAYNSLRQWRRGKKGLKDEGVPRWNYLLLQFQIVVVYVYGAITKLNHDWFLEQEPVRFWLQHTRGIPAFFRNIVEQERVCLVSRLWWICDRLDLSVSAVSQNSPNTRCCCSDSFSLDQQPAVLHWVFPYHWNCITGPGSPSEYVPKRSRAAPG